MHPNPAFRQAPEARNRAFARERGFGTLSINGADGPLISHIPFLLNEAGTKAELHLVRSNPIARAVTAQTPAVIACSGSDSYISPDWYEVEDQVPTWNYVAVHLRGQLEPLPQEALHPMLDRLSAHFEKVPAPKPEWTTDKMTPDVMTKMMRMIQPFKLTVQEINGTWKLGQNKPDEVRQRAAKMAAAYGIGADPHILAALMLDP